MPQKHMEELVQKRRNSSADTLELRLSCTNPLTCRKIVVALHHWHGDIVEIISMGLCKKDVTPVRYQWSYIFLELTLRYSNEMTLTWSCISVMFKKVCCVKLHE